MRGSFSSALEDIAQMNFDLLDSLKNNEDNIRNESSTPFTANNFKLDINLNPTNNFKLADLPPLPTRNDKSKAVPLHNEYQTSRIKPYSDEHEQFNTVNQGAETNGLLNQADSQKSLNVPLRSMLKDAASIKTETERTKNLPNTNIKQSVHDNGYTAKNQKEQNHNVLIRPPTEIYIDIPDKRQPKQSAKSESNYVSNGNMKLAETSEVESQRSAGITSLYEKGAPNYPIRVDSFDSTTDGTKVIYNHDTKPENRKSTNLPIRAMLRQAVTIQPEAKNNNKASEHDQNALNRPPVDMLNDRSSRNQQKHGFTNQSPNVGDNTLHETARRSSDMNEKRPTFHPTRIDSNDSITEFKDQNRKSSNIPIRTMLRQAISLQPESKTMNHTLDTNSKQSAPPVSHKRTENVESGKSHKDLSKNSLNRTPAEIYIDIPSKKQQKQSLSPESLKGQKSLKTSNTIIDSTGKTLPADKPISDDAKKSNTLVERVKSPVAKPNVQETQKLKSPTQLKPFTPDRATSSKRTNFTNGTEPVFLGKSSKLSPELVSSRSKNFDLDISVDPELNAEYLEALEDFVHSSDNDGKTFFEFDFTQPANNAKTLKSQKSVPKENIDSSKWGDQVFSAVGEALEKTADEAAILSKLATKARNLDKKDQNAQISNSKSGASKSPIDSMINSYFSNVKVQKDEVICETIKGKKILKSATLYGLLMHIFDPNNVNLSVLYAFLLHHKVFLPTLDLLEMTISIWRQKLHLSKNPDVIVFHMVNFLDFWIDNFPFDIKEDPVTMNVLSDFVYCHQLSTNKTKVILKTLTEKLNQKMTTGPTKIFNPFLESAPRAVQPHPTYKDSKPQVFRIIEFDYEELARQISLLDFAFFKSTSPRDFIEGDIPRILQWSDHVKWWIISEILNVKDDKLRASTIEHILDTAKELISINNYSGLKSILDAIRSKSIQRLTKTFDKLSKNSKFILSQLNKVVAAENQSLLEERINSSAPPLIPWFGNLEQAGLIYKKIAVKNESLNVLFEKNGVIWIDVKKMAEVSFHIQNIQKWQTVGYNFTPVPRIQEISPYGR